MNMYRQGDVLLFSTIEKKTDGKKVKPINGRIVLVEGEATGHHHSVPEVCEVVDAGERLWMVVPEEVELTHQEHNTIEVAPDTYWVVRQREYTPEEIRRVAD